jgi:quercetin dioxygenase-like cupin family protein
MAVHHVPASAIPDDRAAIEGDGFTASVVRFEPRAEEGPWHHHGDHHVVGYVLAGTVRVHSGPDGSAVAEASAGDLLYVEPGTVHRETYGPEEVGIVGFYLGSGPGLVDVDRPA